MSLFDTFTVHQKETHALVLDLEEELMRSIDPSSFVLNEDVIALRKKIEDAQAHCDHIWMNGACVVCNKEESTK